MLTRQEIYIMKQNAIIHKKIFIEIKKNLKAGISARFINELAGNIAKENGVLCGFKGVYGFPDNICVSVNDVVVHGRPREDLIFKIGDLVTIDFGIKDKKYGINTDAAFSVIIGGDDKNFVGASMIKANKKALKAGIEKAIVGNRIGDISCAIQEEIEKAGFFVVKDLTGHSIGKKLHEKPYIRNYGKSGTGEFLKEGMTLAIEPIIGEKTGEIIDKGDFEIYIKDGSLGCQYEHTILVKSKKAEIIV